jgi:hypothetical protein
LIRSGHERPAFAAMRGLEIIECEWAKARAKNPEVVMRVDVQDETDESGKPRVSVVIVFRTWVTR